MDHGENDIDKPRKRSLTELTLGWIAERLRKSQELKDAIQSGKYEVDSKKVAEKFVNDEQ